MTERTIHRALPVWAGTALMLTGLGAQGCGDDDGGGDNLVPTGFEVSLLSRVRAADSVFDEGSAEIVAYDVDTARAFVTDGNEGEVDVWDLSDPANPAALDSIDLSAVDPAVDGPNSVAVSDGTLAVAIGNEDDQTGGFVAFYATDDSSFLGSVGVGPIPDMVTFTPDGDRVLVAIEAEPNDEYTVDPPGAIAIIDVSGGFESPTVTNAGFEAFDGMEDTLRGMGVRIFGPGASTSMDLEPEYIVVSDDSSTAWAICQENNTLAVVDIDAGEVTDLIPLGFKDHDAAGNGMDASNEDGIAPNIQNWPTKGMYQPDALAILTQGGTPYIFSANEGDSRDYDGFSEEERVADITLDATAFPNAADLQMEANLGRLNITTTLGDDDGNDEFEELYSYGARSMSVWNGNTGALVWDGGDELERVTGDRFGSEFNNNNDENEGDARSDDKGPEPEAVTVGRIAGGSYAFLGLERMGGVVVYDVTDATDPQFVAYVNDRDVTPGLDLAANIDDAGDLGPEGLVFISADDSPNGNPLLLVAAEVSGSLGICELDPTFDRYHTSRKREWPRSSSRSGAFSVFATRSPP